MSGHAALSPGPAGRRAHLRHGLAWVGLCLALAAHVADEALANFTRLYSPAALALGRHVPYPQPPDFAPEVWLTVGVESVIILLMLAPFVFYGARWAAALSHPFAVVAFFYGLSHPAGSVYFSTAVPGLYTSPLLLAGAAYLLVAVHRVQEGRPGGIDQRTDLG
jgi:hypothetical protein